MSPLRCPYQPRPLSGVGSAFALGCKLSRGRHQRAAQVPGGQCTTPGLPVDRCPEEQSKAKPPSHPTCSLAGCCLTAAVPGALQRSRWRDWRSVCICAKEVTEQPAAHSLEPHAAAQTAGELSDAPWSIQRQCLPVRVGRLPRCLPNPLLLCNVQPGRVKRQHASRGGGRLCCTLFSRASSSDWLLLQVSSMGTSS